MNSFLNACLTRGAAGALAVLALTLGAASVRADYLVPAFADLTPPSTRGTLLPTDAPPFFRGEPLTVYRPQEDREEPAEALPDEASLTAAVQALLLCAIPPMDTIITTTTGTTKTTQPGVPAAPTVPQVIYPIGSGTGGSVKTADLPEPTSLVTALVGSSLAGLALWRRRRKLRQQALAA